MSEAAEPTLLTEQENPRTAHISSLPIGEILRLMNEEDARVATAVALVLPEIARAVEGIANRLSQGGRLFYIGTGTSGRLGVLDASECPPTFGVSPDMVQGIIAGGYEACHRAVEASEDDATAGANDLDSRGLNEQDALVGIAASGRTPYTVGAVEHARRLGAFTVALTSVPGSLITRAAELSIVPIVGPEVIAGSTRLKSGTAQKLVLNMLSTAAMIWLGYVTGNRMTNVQTRNIKLRERAERILAAEAGLSEASAKAILDSADGKLPVALVMGRTGCSRIEAETALTRSRGVLAQAIAAIKS
jgi:N-acetylmuramic acid 6-phosphate etherase